MFNTRIQIETGRWQAVISSRETGKPAVIYTPYQPQPAASVQSVANRILACATPELFKSGI